MNDPAKWYVMTERVSKCVTWRGPVGATEATELCRDIVKAGHVAVPSLHLYGLSELSYEHMKENGLLS